MAGRRSRAPSDDEPITAPVRIHEAAIAIPRHVRRAVTYAPPGTVVQLLRDDLNIADLVVEEHGSALANLRDLVTQSTHAEGPARFTIVINDGEVEWSTEPSVGDDDRRPGGYVSAMAYAHHMETMVFRLADKLSEVTTAAASDTRKLVREQVRTSRAQGKMMKWLTKQARKNTGDPELQRQMLELRANSQRDNQLIELASAMFLGGDEDDEPDAPATAAAPAAEPEASPPAAAKKGDSPRKKKSDARVANAVKKAFGMLDDDQRARIMETDDGKGLADATDEPTARKHAAALVSLAEAGEIELPPALLLLAKVVL